MPSIGKKTGKKLEHRQDVFDAKFMGKKGYKRPGSKNRHKQK